VSVFGFIAAEKAAHSIAIMCRVLEVSRSGYHAWRRRPLCPRALEDARLTARIRELHRKRRRVYGSPRIWSDLVLDDGERIGRKRVERLMRQAGLSGLISKKWRTTTVRVPGVRVAEDLLDRDFAAGAPNLLAGKDGDTDRHALGTPGVKESLERLARVLIGGGCRDYDVNYPLGCVCGDAAARRGDGHGGQVANEGSSSLISMGVESPVGLFGSRAGLPDPSNADLTAPGT